jgi:hypothetical protein
VAVKELGSGPSFLVIWRGRAPGPRRTALAASEANRWGEVIRSAKIESQ